MTKQSVESTAGRPPAQAGPGDGEVGDELVDGGEPRHLDLLLTAGLGTAVFPRDIKVSTWLTAMKSGVEMKEMYWERIPQVASSLVYSAPC